MRLEVKGRNVEVNDSIRRYAEDKLDKIEKQLPEPTQIEVELTLETNPSIADDHIAEATVWTKGPILRARESSTDMKASIDQLVDKLERQARRYRDKRRRGPGKSSHHSVEGTPVVPDEDSPLIVKTKQFPVKPMSPEEAVLQLELVGHDFFVFRSDESGEVNVIYRRRDGGYGLIEPQG